MSKRLEHVCKKSKYCSTCYNRDYYENNTEQEKLRSAKYIIAHKEKYEQHSKDHYSKNKDQILEQKKKQYALTGPDKSEERKKYLKEYRETHKETAKENNQKWRELNKEYVKIRHKEYMNCGGKETASKYRTNRKKNDKLFNLECRIRSNLRNRLKNSAKGSIRHLSFTVEDLMHHLQSHFKKDMNWDNMNLWHIDHIVPLKYKNIVGDYYWDQEELNDPQSLTFKLAWSLTNLQPEWAIINVTKSNKYIG